ncbi:aminofutalosine synthase MqnE [Oscillatoria laete-virens NRMC-F 0139]|nr:aminofutalosine synthase MqnE [Oscillatoria laete-virens]MDL5055103.1 aminofutalosine synthase MqnE [Oscillatoria laete-virens NRMC-F 0139]
METLTHKAGLDDIRDKVVAGQRIDEKDALRLFSSPDINAVGAIADHVRRRKNGDDATFILNRYINYSNICILNCQFCAFAKRKGDPEAFEYSVDEMVSMARESLALGITELHIVGGLHPTLPFDYYLDMLRSLKALDSHLHLKCFTAVEIRHLSWRARLSVEETLRKLREAGLGSLTGGGAEIFNPDVRDRICRGKETAEEWADIHKTWHRMGGRSTCTMLYGHVETLEDRIDHLRRLREIQDETGGFTGFIPLAFHPEGNKLSHIRPPSGWDDLRTLAVSRIYLDNIDHITAYWIGLGLNLAQVALSYGVDDLHGTIVEEKIFHMAGSKTPQEQTRDTLIRAIREAGRTPWQRDSHYNKVRCFGGSGENSEANR